ncbi:CocE/NonD family hydrolase [Herbidospora yilanensis]|uniref:CocE/NonD family hydrolase n=1 Tax=Herbidospora yilanensis TaxID=354426 RepID=UPI000785D6B3|nr:CocE/NonD family hydrolase [Herbidospora yilanensis]
MKLRVERDLRVPMRDGTVLLADRWSPPDGDGLPVVLVRTPYGRRRAVRQIVGPLVEGGFQAVVQSTRGTFGSGGGFDPLRRERDDGLDTVEWVTAQPWFGEAMVLYGMSYLGFAQWAVADALPPQVKALVPGVSESALTLEFLRADGFSLETPFSWGVMVGVQERPFFLLRMLLGGRRLQRALRTLPLNRADTAALGRRSDYIQDILRHDTGSPFWREADHRHRVGGVRVPVSLVGGWFDIFLPGQLRDFQASPDARLTVGPWTHVSPGVMDAQVAEALEFALPLARGGTPAERAPVRLYVMGEEKWRDFPSWPPPGYPARRFHLHPGGVLATGTPDESEPSRFRYDPADPTPAVGGVRMAFGVAAGPVDNTALESRADVLTFTTPPLEEAVEVVGEVRAEVFFRSSLPHADVFVRLCDVGPDGRSTNVCDGLTGVAGADEVTAVDVRLWPTAHVFGPGHRIRVQVSSGAFPRYNRNPGTGEPRATATTLRVADQEVFHDPGRPSALVLPVRAAGPTLER